MADTQRTRSLRSRFPTGDLIQPREQVQALKAKVQVPVQKAAKREILGLASALRCAVGERVDRLVELALVALCDLTLAVERRENVLERDEVLIVAERHVPVQTPSRGLYRLASLKPLGSPDLVTVAARVPRGVLCLVSALVFHELTTQVPHTIDIALERGTRKPRLDYPPTRFFWFSGPAFHEGIESRGVDGVKIRVYDPEKTLADCFRYRNKIGMDVVLEALRLWREQRRRKLDVLLKYARLRHVERSIRPYVEALL